MEKEERKEIQKQQEEQDRIRQEQDNIRQKQEEEKEKIQAMKNQEIIQKYYQGERVKSVLTVSNRIGAVPNKIVVYYDRVDLYFTGFNESVVYLTCGFNNFAMSRYVTFSDGSNSLGKPWRTQNDLFFFATALNMHCQGVFQIEEIEDFHEDYLSDDYKAYRSDLLRVDMTRPLNQY